MPEGMKMSEGALERIPRYKVFLGGPDLEQQEILKVLTDKGIPVADSFHIQWGAKVSDYGNQIQQAIKEGYVPVLVELNVDTEVPEGCIIVDHHGSDSQKPASILQICELLKIQPDRELELVAWNDAGWIPKMREMGASDEEIKKIRLRDRMAQGFDKNLENESIALARTAEIHSELGLAILKDLPITRFAGIKDQLALEKKIYNIICIAAPKGDNRNVEIEFQGDGLICAELTARYQGWSGGDGLGHQDGTAYWGGYSDDPSAFIEYIKERLQAKKLSMGLSR